MLAIASAAVTAAALALPTTASATPDRTDGAPVVGAGNGVYLVQLADAPVATYEGGVAGIPATRPALGAKVDLRSAAAKKYSGYLKGKRDKVLARIDGEKKLYDYSTAFNGFAAKVTSKQVQTLRRTPGVVSVVKDELRSVETISTPDFLGLTGPAGVWQKQFGGPAKAGDGVIVGSVDSGLWPENPSFAPLPASPTDAKIGKKFKGVCDAGIERPFFVCNNKVIGGRWFVQGFDAGNLIPAEYLSPRDYDGHGSHTASTAAGNNDVPVVVDGNDLGRASGMAPAARIAVYKVCWNAGDGGCATSDSVAAIDAAVADGVDVINFSISGSLDTVYDAVEFAFYNAAKAGVFVAASAGNSGPAASTVAHNSPWLTTVAAGTKDQAASKSVTLGNGSTYTGIGVGPAVPSSPLVLSTAAAKAGANPNEARLCFLGTLDPATTAGKIVVCDRGVNDRTEKSREVRDAGGVGMVLTNVSPSSLNADLHYVPTVHVDEVAGAAIKAYAVTPGATAALSVGTYTRVEAAKVASFSSRGPALAGDGDLLKPDIMAPGVDVLAAVAPPNHNGRNFDYESGTSMSSPHIAGIAALVIGKHPGWSPTAVKSALMTTATTRTNQGNPITTDNGGPAGPLDYGSGEVVPAKAFDPGLVYESTSKDWDRFTCNYGDFTPAFKDCAGLKALDPSDLNYPSIAVGDLTGIQTVTRTVKNVTGKSATYVASVSEPAGVDVTVSPTRFTIAPHATKTYKVTITRVSAAYDAFTAGSITWLDGKHSVRSPLVVRPVAISAPDEITGTGTSGSEAIPVTPGFTGTLQAKVVGLAPATVTTSALSPTGPQIVPTAPVVGPRTSKTTVTVPAGTTLARYATYAADYPADTDMDVYVYKEGTNTLVASSAGGSADEDVTIVGPEPGRYDVYVTLFAGPPVTAKLNTFLVGDTAVGNAAVTPTSQPATLGQPTSVTLTWTGLTAGRWLGWVGFSDGGTGTGLTVVTITA